MGRYQKSKTNVDFTGARDSEWQWHQLGHMQVCTSLQTDNHASTPPLSFLQAGCPFCRPTNSIKALKVMARARSGGKKCRHGSALLSPYLSFSYPLPPHSPFPHMLPPLPSFRSRPPLNPARGSGTALYFVHFSFKI